MRFLVLGAGRQGRAAAYDLLRHGAREVILADQDRAAAEEACRWLARPEARPLQLDASRRDDALGAMRGVDVVFSAIDYRLNLELSRAAIEAGCHFVDLGGNNDVVDAQFGLDAEARTAGVAIVPDCGLAPGMAGILGARAVEAFERADSVRIRVGGLPQNPEPPLEYQLTFSVRGLINEYAEPCRVLRDGEEAIVEPLTEVEPLDFAPLGRLEAFHTSGGVSTLTRTLRGRVRNLDYKTIRYPGHAARMKLLLDIGLASQQPVPLASARVAPREMLATLLTRVLPHDGPDLIVVRIEAEGLRGGRAASYRLDLLDRAEPEKGLTAMMKTTAFPASIIALMLARGEIAGRGTIHQESGVPHARFFEELRKRGFELREEWR